MEANEAKNMADCAALHDRKPLELGTKKEKAPRPPPDEGSCLLLLLVARTEGRHRPELPLEHSVVDVPLSPCWLPSHMAPSKQQVYDIAQNTRRNEKC